MKRRGKCETTEETELELVTAFVKGKIEPKMTLSLGSWLAGDAIH